jgi:long-chain acyl-CoA synthetase/monooxygenase
MIVLWNSFVVTKGSEKEFEEGYRASLAFMKFQKGLLRARLHRSLSDPTHYCNYAEWESREDFERAVAHPDFQPMLEKSRRVASFQPELFQVLSETAP